MGTTGLQNHDYLCKSKFGIWTKVCGYGYVLVMNLRCALLSPDFCYMTLENCLKKNKTVRRPLVLRNHDCLACYNRKFEQDIFWMTVEVDLLSFKAILCWKCYLMVTPTTHLQCMLMSLDRVKLDIFMLFIITYLLGLYNFGLELNVFWSKVIDTGT